MLAVWAVMAVAQRELALRLGVALRRHVDAAADDDASELVAAQVHGPLKRSARSWETVDLPAAMTPVTTMTCGMSTEVREGRPVAHSGTP